MGRGICYVKDGEEEFYFLWSSIVDSPITFGMGLEEFMEFMHEEYGRLGWSNIEGDLERARRKGISWRNYTLDEVILLNRAGKNETRLTKEELIEWFCRKRENPPVGVGAKINFEEE